MKVGIIGAGIGGITTAVFLQKSGIEVEIFEKSQSFQPVGAEIGLGSNAMVAFDRMGESEKIKQEGMPLHEKYLLDNYLKKMNKFDFSKLKALFEEETITIQRASLHQALLNYVNQETIQFNKQATHYKHLPGKL